MELKRRWQSFFHRIAEWKTHERSELTSGAVMQREIDLLISSAHKELIIVDFITEPLFADIQFYETILDIMRDNPDIEVSLILYVPSSHVSLVDSVTQHVSGIFEANGAVFGESHFSLFLLKEEPYVLFYMNEQDILIKDILNIRDTPISLKFTGKNVFEKDCRAYAQFLIESPSETRLLKTYGQS